MRWQGGVPIAQRTLVLIAFLLTAFLGVMGAARGQGSTMVRGRVTSVSFEDRKVTIAHDGVTTSYTVGTSVRIEQLHPGLVADFYVSRTDRSVMALDLGHDPSREATGKPSEPQSSSDFYYVYGTDYLLPDTLLSGNPPLPSGAMAAAAGVLGLVLLLAVAMVERILPWRAMSRGRRLFLRVLLVSNFFLLWEVGLQVCASRFHEPTFVPDPETFWKLNPALANQWLQEAPNRSDWWSRNRGPLPDDALQREKPSGSCRVVFFGESQLVSIDHQEINLPRSYPRLLGRRLAKSLPSRRFDMVNAGVPGFSSWQGLLLCRQVIDQQIDMVVFAFAYHDCHPAYAADRAILTNDPYVHRIRTWLYRSELFLLLRQLIIKLRESHEEAALRASVQTTLPTFRVPPDEFERNLRELARLGRERGVRVTFLLEPLAPGNDREASVLRYHEIMRRVAREEGDVLVIDVFSSMREQTGSTDTRRYWDDSIHMSSAGHEVVARIVEEALRNSGLPQFQEPTPAKGEPSSPH